VDVIEQPPSDEESQFEQENLMRMIVEIRQKAFLQIVYGLLWWLGSSIAMAIALSMTGGTFYWYGGALGSLFHWYRAAKMINATRKVGAKPLIKNEGILIGVTAVLVVVSTATIVPEYFRIDSPTIGTCWGATEGQLMSPVACWSPNASVKIIAYANTSNLCPSETTGFFDPSSRESQFTCLIDN
jgi:hypothetical protein